MDKFAGLGRGILERCPGARDKGRRHHGTHSGNLRVFRSSQNEQVSILRNSDAQYSQTLCPFHVIPSWKVHVTCSFFGGEGDDMLHGIFDRRHIYAKVAFSASGLRLLPQRCKPGMAWTCF